MNIDIPDDLPVDEDFVKEATGQLNVLSKDMMKQKMEEAELLRSSAADGGPDSIQGAFIHLMKECNIGVRRMAERIGVKRKVLQKMLDGEIALEPRIMVAMENVFQTIKPELFK